LEKPGLAFIKLVVSSSDLMVGNLPST